MDELFGVDDFANGEVALRLFRKLVSIPRPSGEEQEVALYLKELMEAHGCTVEMDSANNLRIDRPASPGYENRPLVILQGHTDMVLVLAPGVDRSVIRNPGIQLLEKDGWLQSDGKTSIGADDGVGVAMALSILMDKDFVSGPLRVILTTEEETGMNGAIAMDSQWLAGAKCLLNLDDCLEGELIISSAGGRKMDFRFPMENVSPSAGEVPCLLRLEGMLGGHSGAEIHKNRGNALQAMGVFLSRHPEFHVASLNGGRFDNVIPSSAVAEGAIQPEDIPVLEGAWKAYRQEVSTQCNLPDTAKFECEALEKPLAGVWKEESAREFLAKLSNSKNGVQSFSQEYGVTETSLNIAIIQTTEDALKLTISLRSAFRAALDDLEADLRKHYAIPGAEIVARGGYSAWPPSKDKSLLNLAMELWKKMQPELWVHSQVIHAGLEVGVFAEKMPGLQQLSMGPNMFDEHNLTERVEIASVHRMVQYLRALIGKIQDNA